MVPENRPSLAAVENAFQPAKEVDSAERFAGRKEAVSDSYYSLLTLGSNIAVVGNRGIGKTSLARQIILMAEGDDSLLNKLSLPSDEKLDFLTFYYACGNNIFDVDSLLEGLLTSKNCLSEWVYEVPKAETELKKYSPKLSANLLGIAVELGGEKSSEREKERVINSHKIETVFLNVCSSIIEQNMARDGILIVIDEFDQIKDKTGFAGMIKSAATNIPKLKFCIVGVAQDIQNLMEEHESADRLFAGSIIRLPHMSDSELKEIIHIAEYSIDEYMKFSDDAEEIIVRIAQGHPYMVHLVGKYAFRNAHVREYLLIDEELIKKTMRDIAEKGHDPVLERRYRIAIGGSPQREIVLKAMAEVVDSHNECWTRSAYGLAESKGVENSSQYVGQLVTAEYGAEITKVRDRYYSFRDSLFAAYVKARPYSFNAGTTNPNPPVQTMPLF
jgi:Cdc6-like AAA superfamily ATPase